jgi:ribosome-binding factor A
MPKDFARTDRVAEQIQRELAELLRLEVKDPRVRMVTLTGVEVARDYSHAKVYYTVLSEYLSPREAPLSNSLDKTTSHSTKLPKTAAKSLVIPPAGETTSGSSLVRGGKKAITAVQQGLERASGFLRSQLAHRMKLRIMPQLHFVFDASVERGAHLSQLIDQAVASDHKLN